MTLIPPGNSALTALADTLGLWEATDDHLRHVASVFSGGSDPSDKATSNAAEYVLERRRILRVAFA
jgi:hypothetical protein